MANERNFENNKILLFNETVEGETPVTIAKAYAVKTTELSFDVNQRTEENALLGNGGQPTRVDIGGEDPSGTLGLKSTPDNDTLMINKIVGEYTVKTTLNAAHATATAYAQDDVVVLAGDVLVCKTAGTSGVTAPVVTTNVTGDEITDGTVTWVITKGKTAMYEYTCPLSKDSSTLGMIIRDVSPEGGGVTHDILGRGISLTSLMFGKESGGVIAKNSHSAVGHGAIPSSTTGYVAPTITTEVATEDNPYKRDDICVTINGVAVKQISNLTFTLDTATTIEDAIACITVAGVQVSEKITTKGIQSLKGSASVRFSVEEFKQAIENAEQSIVVTYKKPTGQFTQYTVPNVQLIDPKRTYDTTKPIVIENTLSAYGTAAVPALTVTMRSFLDYTK